MIKRGFDFFFSLLGIFITLPLLLIIYILVKLNSKGPAIFVQRRVGRNNKEFNIYKFRTMISNHNDDKKLTVGDKDIRVTKIGYYLRKYKLDELPQLFNVLIGKMSFVGPRPELRYFVNHYDEVDLEILTIKPGITDYASIAFRNEAELLKSATNPEQFYIDTIIPKKIQLNRQYLEKQNISTDISIIFKTIKAIFLN